METLDDAALVGRVVASPDPAAEAELVRRFAPRVRLYGLRHLRDEAAADDLVQEVLAMTLTTAREGRLQQPDRLSSFVLGSCRLIVRNLRRTEQRRRRLLGAYAQEQAGVVEPAKASEQRLTTCLEALAERARAVVVLTFYAGRSAGEIGAELGASAGNVRVIRHRALAQLLACMTGEAS